MSGRRHLGVRVVPLGQQTPALRFRQDVDVQGLCAPAVVGGEGIAQAGEGGDEVVGDGVRGQGVVDLEVQRQFAAEVVDGHGHRVVDAVHGGEEPHSGVVDADSGRLVVAGFEVAEIPDRAEQRHVAVHTTAPLGETDGCVLAGDQAPQSGVDLVDQLPDRAAGQPDPQREGVDEVAEHPLDAGHVLQPPGHHGAEDDVVAVAARGHHPCPGCVEQAGGAQPQPLGVVAQPPGEFLGQGAAQLDHPAGVTVHVGQSERQGRLGDVAEDGAEVLLRVPRGLRVQGVGDEVPVRRRGRQQVGAVGQVQGQLPHGQPQGGGVLDEVVGGEDEVAALGLWILGDGQPKERGPVEGQAGGPGQQRPRLLLGAGIGRQEDAVHRQAGGAVHDLYGVGQAGGQDGGAHRVVAVDNALERRGEPGARLLVVGHVQGGDEVGVVIGVHQVVEEDAVLGGQQWVDVLDVVRAAGHGGRDGVDLLLVEADQGQHPRSDAGAPLGDQVGRDAVPVRSVGAVDPGGEGGEAGGGEDVLHGDRQAVVLQPGHQHGDHQGVSAEGEEVGLGADAVRVETQQFGPHLGQQPFGVRARSDIGALAERVDAGGGQGLAVQLAVGAHGQDVQGDEGAGHHVLGQDALKVPDEVGPVILQGVFRGQDRVGDEQLTARWVLADDDGARADCGVLDEALLDLPGSMRKPRSLTWSSARPMNSRLPSGSHRTRSPVRYMLVPGPVNGFGTNRSRVSSGWCR